MKDGINCNKGLCHLAHTRQYDIPRSAWYKSSCMCTASKRTCIHSSGSLKVQSHALGAAALSVLTQSSVRTRQDERQKHCQLHKLLASKFDVGLADSWADCRHACRDLDMNNTSSMSESNTENKVSNSI